MKEPAEESNNSCKKRGIHLKVLIICLVCTLVYVYLYSNLTIRAIAVSDMMKNTIDDLQRLQNKVEEWVRGFPGNSSDQSTGCSDRRNKCYDQSIASTEEQTAAQPPKLTSTSLNITIANSNISKVLIQTMTLKNRRMALKESILKNEANPLITLFTTWPAKKEKFFVHNSTIRNWKALSPFVKPVLFTNEEELGNRVRSMGWSILPVTKSAIGIPILKYMYLDAMANFKSTFYAYCNGDILFTENLIETLLSILNFNIDFKVPMLLVGQRTNVQNVTEDEASSFDKITKASKRGTIFTSYAEDYFITTSNYPWKDCAEVVIGRRAYDNWLVLNARKHNYTTIDGSKTLLAVHQTTKAGNYEGHAVPNSNYNDKLLVGMYRRVYYGSGLTSCTTFYTVPSESGPNLIERKIHKGCFPL